MPTARILTFALLLASALWPSALAHAQTDLTVATKVAPPFAMQDADGQWRGLSIELWRRIADKEQLTFEFREMTLQQMLESLQSGAVDVATAALTVTAAREETLDFSHAFLPSGLGIATTQHEQGTILRLVRKLISQDFLSALGALALVLVVCGALVWLLERRANPEQFGGKGLAGIGAGLWFSAVTMTTVGYGDKAPQTVGGRIVALVWMFASIIVISSYTAAIASSLTVDDLATIRSADDLSGHRIGSVPGSSSAEWLASRGLRFVAYDSVEPAVADLASGELEAIVYDQPLLRYLVQQDAQSDLVVLPEVLRQENYALGLPAGSPLRERINRRILEITVTDEWRQLVARYLGD